MHHSTLAAALLLLSPPPASSQPSTLSTFAGGSTSPTNLTAALPLLNTGITGLASDGATIFFATASDIRSVPLYPSGLALGPVTLIAGNPYYANTSITSQQEGLIAADPTSTRVSPTALAANGTGLFFVDSFTRTLRFISNATSPLGAAALVWTAAGNGSLAAGVYPGFPFSAAPARAVPLGAIAALALSGDGATLYIAKTALNVIRAFACRAGTLRVLAGTGAPSTVAGAAIGAPWQPWLSANLTPSALALQPGTGALFFVDSTCTVRVLNTSGLVSLAVGAAAAVCSTALLAGTMAAPGAAIATPVDVAFSATGALIISVVNVANGYLLMSPPGLGGGGVGNVSVMMGGSLYTAANYNDRQGVFVPAVGCIFAVGKNLLVGGAAMWNSGVVAYAAEPSNGRIRVLFTGGTVGTLVGAGSVPLLMDGVSASSTQIYGGGFALDVEPVAGLLLAADSYYLRAYSLSKGTVVGNMSIGFGSGRFSITASGSSTTQSTTNYVFGVAADGAGGYFFTQSTNSYNLSGAGSVAYVNATGLVSRVTSGTALPCYGNGGPAGSAGFLSPRGLVFDKPRNKLYVFEPSANVVRCISNATGCPFCTVSHFAGTCGNGSFSYGDGGPAASAILRFPEQGAVDAAGNLYIVDSTANRVRFVSAATGNISTFAGTGVASSTGDNGLATAASLNAPKGIALDTCGSVFISDGVSAAGGGKIRRVNSTTGVITTVIGSAIPAPYPGSSGDGGVVSTSNSLLFKPGAVTVAPDGRLFFADTVYGRVRALSPGPSAACAPPLPLPSQSSTSSFTPSSSPTLTPTPSPPPCPAGTYGSSPAAGGCAPCPAGYYCPAGTTLPFALPCNAGSYCPAGSPIPIPCPPMGWTDATRGPANGPAFDLDTATCYNHCFFGGDGQLSSC